MRLSRPFRPDEILDLGDYERARPEMRARAMAARTLRRVEIGPAMSVTFECRETIRYQIQEMLRAERIAQPEAVAHEIETYGELLPGPDEMSATLMIEIPDPEERAARLAELVGLERHVHLVAGTSRTAARFDDRQIDPDRVSAVQFVRFPLDATAAATLRRGDAITLIVDHPAYRHETTIRAETVGALIHDLDEARA